MIISHQHRYVFVSTPKTGTHSIYEVLRTRFAGVQQEGPYHRREIPEDARDFFCFTSVRHPVERFVSAYNSLSTMDPYKELYEKAVGGLDLEAFIDWTVGQDWKDDPPKLRGNQTLMPMHLWLRDIPVVRWLRLESIAADFAELPFVERAIEFPHRLAREHATASEMLTEKQMARLNDFYREDLRLYSYPALRREVALAS